LVYLDLLDSRDPREALVFKATLDPKALPDQQAFKDLGVN